MIGLLLIAQLSLPQVQTLQGLLAQIQALLSPPVVSAQTLVVTGDLQAAINAAPCGTTIVLPAASTFTGNFTVSAKGCAMVMTSDTPTTPGVRVSLASALPKIISPNAAPALATKGKADGWSFIDIGFYEDGGGDLVTAGDGSNVQNTLALVPQNLVFDRCVFSGSDAHGGKRGIALNSGATTIENSYFANFKLVGQDAQAIAGWNGPGPYTITNNYIEGAANNLIFGGTDPAIPNLVPSDITISGNTINKPVAWKTQSWQVKNLLELKNAQRVTSSNNLYTNVWSAAQGGYAWVFTVRNQGGGCPWCIVANVTSNNDHISHAAAVLQTLGSDDTPGKPSLRLTNVKITNLVADDIDKVTWTGPSAGSQQWILIAGGLTGGVNGLELGHVTITGGHVNAFMSLGGATAEGVNIHDSIFLEGDYGITGTNVGQGRLAFNAFSPMAVFTNNAIIKTPTADGSVRNINYGPQPNYVLPIGTLPTGLTYPTTDSLPLGAKQ